MKKEWKLISKKEVFTKPFIRIEDWDFVVSDGSTHTFSMTMSKDVAVVFALDDAGNALIVREYYMSLQERVAGLVAGIVEEGESPLENAQKELREEAGCEAGEFVSLGYAVFGKYFPAKIHFFLAKGARIVGEQQLEPEEDIVAEFVSLDEVKDLVRTSQFHSIHDMACAYRAMDHIDNM